MLPCLIAIIIWASVYPLGWLRMDYACNYFFSKVMATPFMQ